MIIPEGITSQYIPTDRIRVGKIAKEERTHDKEFEAGLAQSIGQEGLLKPIIVARDPEDPTWFNMIAGRHRHGAVKNHLKWDLIEAKVLPPTTTEEEATIIRTAENFFHNPLSKAQHARAMAVWHDYYDKQVQAYKVAKKAAKASEKLPNGRPPKTSPAKSNLDLATQSESVAPVEPTPAPIPLPPEPPKDFAKHVAEVTGVSPTTVKRQLKIGKAFTPAQLEIIEQCGVSQVWQETIAGEPAEKRAAIINFIATGLDEASAIARVNETPEVRRANGEVYQVTPDAGPKGESDMTDEEWVNFHCSDTLALLPEKTAFTRHALLYRHTRDLRMAFKGKVKAEMDTAKQANLWGGLYAVIHRLVTVSHPSKWFKCSGCDGTGAGTKPNGSKPAKCGDCSGNGFIVKFESK